MIENQLLDFVRFSIRSVWNVELLLRLCDSSPRTWTVDELVRELRASAAIVNEGLRTLEVSGLVVAESGGTAWRYSPASPQFDQLARELKTLYRERPTAVAEALFSTRDDRLRSFAEAFRLRKG